MKRKDFIVLNNSLRHKKVSLEKINKMVDEGKAKQLVQESEAFFYNQIEEIIDDMLSQKKRLLFLAGPSSAGKTTTAKLLQIFLKQKNISSEFVSLDDFLLPHENRVLLANGKVDFESVFALDIPLINEFLDQILSTGQAQSPKFDMQTNKRCEKGENKTLSKNGILIVEGIHALNPLIISPHSDSAYKVYLCPYDDLYFQNKRILMAQEIRMMRRCFRDCQTRNYTVEQSLSSWHSVRKGEQENIKPFKLNSDYFLNTSIKYEVLVYNTYFKPMLMTSPLTDETMLLIGALDKCAKLDKSLIPENSLLWEFLIK